MNKEKSKPNIVWEASIIRDNGEKEFIGFFANRRLALFNGEIAMGIPEDKVVYLPEENNTLSITSLVGFPENDDEPVMLKTDRLSITPINLEERCLNALIRIRNFLDDEAVLKSYEEDLKYINYAILNREELV